MLDPTDKRLADALIALTNERTFADIAVCDICKRCQLSRQTFYNHFADKYALADHIFTSEVLNCTPEHGRSAPFDRMLAVRLHALKKNARFYLRVTQQDCVRDSFFALASQSIVRCVASRCSGTLNSALRFTIDFYCHGCMETIRDWLLNGSKKPVHELAARLVDCMPDELAHYLTNDYLSDYL